MIFHLIFASWSCYLRNLQRLFPGCLSCLTLLKTNPKPWYTLYELPSVVGLSIAVPECSLPFPWPWRHFQAPSFIRPSITSPPILLPLPFLPMTHPSLLMLDFSLHLQLRYDVLIFPYLSSCSYWTFSLPRHTVAHSMSTIILFPFIF